MSLPSKLVREFSERRFDTVEVSGSNPDVPTLFPRTSKLICSYVPAVAWNYTCFQNDNGCIRMYAITAVVSVLFSLHTSGGFHEGCEARFWNGS